VKCSDNQFDQQGVKMEDQYANIKAALEEAKDNATWPVTLYDPFGNTKYVRFLPVDPFEEMVEWHKGKNPEILFHLLMQEVSLA